MKSLTVMILAGAALTLAACGVSKSNYSSDWCISTDGLTFEERVWANEVCSRGHDGQDVGRDNNDNDDNKGEEDDAPGNSDDHRQDDEHRKN